MEKRPNVVLVLTDDQGYPDLGCTGNPYIHTPNIDEFCKEGVFLNDFHVAPLCAPSRGELMTGRCAIRNGVWATCWGRSILAATDRVVAQTFKENGYETGMFGKWHLGDSYPYRPMDRGFSKVVAHKGGGVGQTPDFWGNNYFDDTYFKNGKPVSYDGYCTDVWFEQAIDFITDNKDKPFFCYIATNAPHSPYLVDEKYSKGYKGNEDIFSPEFYGMIQNIDENFGTLVAKLKELNIEDNTIIIFMTDNGSSGSCALGKNQLSVRGYNAGLRGKKGSFYDGGHKVPFIIKWENGKIKGGRTLEEMCLGIDLYPTLVELCGLTETKADWDGKSFADCLLDENKKRPEDRVHFIQYHQWTNLPEKWDCAVITKKWRMVHGKELYDIENDPSQIHDVADEYPEVMKDLLEKYEQWWNETGENCKGYQPIYLGCEEENPVRLDSMDVMGDVAWSQNQVAAAIKSAGKWDVRICKKGKYKITLSRWPEELAKSYNYVMSQEEISTLAQYGMGKSELSSNINIKGSELIVDGKSIAVSDDNIMEYVAELDENKNTVLEASFILDDGSKIGAYYVYVEYLGE